MAQFPARRITQAGPALLSPPPPPPLLVPEPDGDDSDSASLAAMVPENSRKRPRLGGGNGSGIGIGSDSGSIETLTAVCDQCRTRKIRCDRRQPNCSNCIKAGFECNSTNSFKRVNPVKQLRDEFSDVLNHLRDVDKTLGTLTTLTRQIAARPCPHTTHPQLHPHASCPPAHHAPAAYLPGFLDPLQPTPQQHRPSSADRAPSYEPLCEIAEFDNGGERLYSDPAPLVLIRSLLRQVTDALDSHDEGGSQRHEGCQIAPALREPAVQATLHRKLDDFPFHSRCWELGGCSDSDPVTTPPQLIVNLLGDGYLRNINARTPIFDDEELRRAIDAHYAESAPQRSSSWALIINNIVLLELGLEIRTARASHSHPRGMGMDDDIIPSFLQHCHRAISNLDAFMTPSLVNVQALMTLTLVAREFYNSATAEKICHAACQVGRAMGLHRSVGAGRDPKHSDGEGVRHRLFRVLYAMDKQRVFMTGQPCDLYMFDADHQLGSKRGHEESNSPISDAFDEMMVIWEEIYLNLYSSRAAVASPETRAHQVRRVSGSLYNFARAHSELIALPSFADGIADANLMLIELVYGYQVSQVLVLRCDRHDEQGLDKMRDFARSSLRVMLEMGRGPRTAARLALLASMFRRYPMVAFVELVAFRLDGLFSNGSYDSTAQADVALLRTICDQLQTLQHDNLPHSFYARLKLGLAWAIDTLEAMGKAIMGLSLPRTEGSRSPEPSSHPSAPSPNFTIPDILHACNFHHAKSNQDKSHLTSKRRGDEIFGQDGLAEITNWGFVTPGRDRRDLASVPLSTGHLGASSSSVPPSQLGLTSASTSGNPTRQDFNTDFFQGSLV
ncbi:hypothetical protein F5Y14DRAFT_441186 [Nemania sp. NC0429]|nr:hypothetical protein F5Y14DRAFT_441186 [Nemania sp. NC0429]